MFWRATFHLAQKGQILAPVILQVEVLVNVGFRDTLPPVAADLRTLDCYDHVTYGQASIAISLIGN